MEIILILIIALILLFLSMSLKQIYTYEKGIKFTLGKYSGIMNEGLNFLIPFIQEYIKVDTRQRTINLPPQEVMTQDKVNLKIDGLVFYSIEEPEKAVLNVSNLQEQLEGKASSELKEIIGSKTLSESLIQRDEIAKELKEKLEKAIEDKIHKKDWGIVIRAIQINNIELPQELVRAMSKQAEAEREKEARITKALGEYEASKKFSEASILYKNNKEAMRLRELQTYQEIGTEHNSLIIVVPETMTNTTNLALMNGLSEIRKVDKIKK